MKTNQFSQLAPQEQEWLDAYLEGEMSREDFEAMQDRMVESAEFRKVMRRYLSVDHSLEVLQGGTLVSLRMKRKQCRNSLP